ncbi:ThiF family adenylyltransferase [Candidatus Micrarchaeota archaeon]|nr:ThiF family adenylyltransferase [Candidatus Micrarchaeota archaeon]
MRYRRMLVMTRGFEKLKTKTAAIVGCGNLGSKNALLLARWGINLILIDFDKVSEPNLGTQEYCEKDVGRCKVACLKKQLKSVNSNLKVTAINKKLTEKNAKQLLKNADIVIDASDNLETRFAINEACKALHVPWIYGSVELNNGVVAAFGEKYGFDKIVSKTARTKRVDSVGVTPNVASVVAGIQASLAVKILSGQRIARDVAFVDLDSLSIERVKNIGF